jgi:hypothetical protein
MDQWGKKGPGKIPALSSFKPQEIQMKREFVVQTTVVIEDTEADGFHDQKVIDILEDRLNVFQDAVRGSVDRDVNHARNGKVLRTPAPKVSFENTDIHLRAPRK